MAHNRAMWGRRKEEHSLHGAFELDIVFAPILCSVFRHPPQELAIHAQAHTCTYPTWHKRALSCVTNV